MVVEEVIGEANDIKTLGLSCISDDAQGERLDVLWDAEIGAVELDTDSWRNIGTGLPDKAEVLAAHLRAISLKIAKLNIGPTIYQQNRDLGLSRTGGNMQNRLAAISARFSFRT